MLPSCIHTINYDENEDENEKYDITDPGLDMGMDIVNIKSVSL